jgi:hypothetical protein
MQSGESTPHEEAPTAKRCCCAQVENLCYERRDARGPRPVGFHVPAGIGYPVNR